MSLSVRVQMSMLDVFKSIIETYGLTGIFVISLVSNAIPYMTIPYLLLVIVYSATVTNPLFKILIIFFSGLGASLGKVIVYIYGYSIRYVLSEETKNRMSKFIDIFKRSTFIAILAFSMTPLPDDVLYIPIGLLKYDLKKYFVAVLIGKTMLTAVATYYGSIVHKALFEQTVIPLHLTIIILVLITIYITYLAIRINWFNIAEDIQMHGWRKGVKTLIKEVANTTKTLLFKLIRVKS